MPRYLFAILLAVSIHGRGIVAEDSTGHWAYTAPLRPPFPTVTDRAWVRNAIDIFALSRMESAGVKPSPEADRATLARRLSLDLLCLPLPIAELDEFLADASPDAYERLVDRLLASPRFGERMAQHWLDAARYADTHGYLIDAHREMWPWRDWVIEAYNSDMRFDQFTLEQLAGDLIPNATLAQRIASGFNRNHMVNYENGAIPEEYQVEYVADRVATTSTVWLGQTMQCARCHDHKYDPFTVRDFYQFFAFFNNVPESGLDGNRGNAVPLVKAPTLDQQHRMQSLDQQMEQIQRALESRRIATAEAFAAWETMVAQEPQGIAPPDDPAIHLPFDQFDAHSTPIRRTNPTKVESATVHGNPSPVRGRSDQALLFDGETHVEAGEFAVLPNAPAWSISLWLFATTTDRLEVVSFKTPDGKETAHLKLDDGHIHLQLQLGDSGANRLEVRSKVPLTLRTWQHVAVAWDGSSPASSVRIYENGKPVGLETVSDQLSRPLSVRGTWHIGGITPDNLFRGMIDDCRIFSRDVTPAEAAALGGNDPLRDLLAIPAARRSVEQRMQLREQYLGRNDAEFRRLADALAAARRQYDEVVKAAPTSMVMQELPGTRDTWILHRGVFDQHGDKVSPNTPALLPAFPEDYPRNRLGLARWLIDPANPLTARVTVNRLWQQFFGTGLVRTPEDFGTRGEPPTHPELLDWLAVEFRERGWGVKDFVRLLVTSAAYRQSSRFRPDLAAQDPENRLWGRACRWRLDAEAIRDGALGASGLLDDRIGGPGVFPYQPPGLWEEVSYNPGEFTAQAYVQSHGRDLYRRGIYTFWKRTLPPPTMLIFDAPTRESCTVERTRSNTPLQALLLMNETALIEASRKLAETTLSNGGDSSAARIRFAFRTVTARSPDAEEVAELARLLDKQLVRFRAEPKLADSLIQVGEAPHDSRWEPAELAAWTTLMNVLLSLDEAITRE